VLNGSGQASEIRHGAMRVSEMREPACKTHTNPDGSLGGDGNLTFPSAAEGRRTAARSRRRAITVGVLVVSDVVAIFLSEALATAVSGFPPAAVVRAAFATIPPALGAYAQLIVLPVLWFAFMAVERLYDPDRLEWGSGQMSRTLRALTSGVVVFVIGVYMLALNPVPRLWVIVAWVAAVALVVGGRLVVRDWLVRLRDLEVLRRPTLIVGSNQEAADITRGLSRPGTGLTPVGYVSSALKDQLSLDYQPQTVPNLGSPREIAEVVRGQGIDTVVIVGSAFDYEILDRIIGDLRGTDVSIRVATGLSNVLSSRVLIGQASGIPLITVKSVALNRRQLTTKRAFDLSLSLLAVLVLSPVWLALIAAIKLTSRGPIFYRQERVGESGEPFLMYKFRSMVADADDLLGRLRKDNEADGPLFKMKDDPRITPIGRFMRQFSLDELPQVINVLRCEMSIVGPRPPLPDEAAVYPKKACKRLEVLPGLTGLWQVSGRSDLSFDEMIELDLFYIDNWSVMFDLSVIARTIPAVLSRRGAY
jgi:exopolysaccharide biosynthesis polyprenyl glycosylphosphotransferase